MADMVSLHVSRGREVAHTDRHLAGWQEVLRAEACGGYSAKMNDIEPRAWLADVLARLQNITASQVPDLLPWNRKSHRQAA